MTPSGCLVEGEGAANAAVGEGGIGEDELDAAAGVEARDDVGERGLRRSAGMGAKNGGAEICRLRVRT